MCFDDWLIDGGGSRRGAWPGDLASGRRKYPSEVQGPVGVLDEVPQKLKQNVKLLYNF